MNKNSIYFIHAMIIFFCIKLVFLLCGILECVYLRIINQTKMKTVEVRHYRIYSCFGDMLFSSTDLEKAEAQLSIEHELDKEAGFALSRIEVEIEEIEIDYTPDPDDAYDLWREQQEFN